MKHYEVTFIVDPVLSGDEIKTAAQVYEDLIKNEGASIVHVDEMGLKQLAYPINKRSSGIYFSIEYSTDSADLNNKMELALKRDERIMRFLTIFLDKYGVKYNQDKRDGKIGVAKKSKSDKKSDKPKSDRAKSDKPRAEKPAPKPAEKPAPKPAPVAVVADAEEE